MNNAKELDVLRITIELVPGGREESAIVIGRGSIAKISALADVSNHACAFEENAWKGRHRRPYRADLTAWPRNERGVWEIVHAALVEDLKARGNNQPTGRRRIRT